jgi:hypothetical protein
MKNARVMRLESLDVYAAGRNVFAHRSQYLTWRSRRRIGSGEDMSTSFIANCTFEGGDDEFRMTIGNDRKVKVLDAVFNVARSSTVHF